MPLTKVPTPSVSTKAAEMIAICPTAPSASVLLAPLLRNEKFGCAYVVLSYVPRGRGGYVAPFSGVISQIKIKATTSSNLRKGRRLHFFILYHLATY